MIDANALAKALDGDGKVTAETTDERVVVCVAGGVVSVFTSLFRTLNAKDLERVIAAREASDVEQG